MFNFLRMGLLFRSLGSQAKALLPPTLTYSHKTTQAGRQALEPFCFPRASEWPACYQLVEGAGTKEHQLHPSDSLRALHPLVLEKGSPHVALGSQRLRAGFDIFCLKGQDLQQVTTFRQCSVLGLGGLGSHGVPLCVPYRKDKGLRDGTIHDSERVDSRSTTQEPGRCPGLAVRPWASIITTLPLSLPL